MSNTNESLVGLIWNIANKLRGPYRPPQYRRVMLPMIVLRRLDCLLAADKPSVLLEYEKLKDKNLTKDLIQRKLAHTASKDRKHPIYNISQYDFNKLLDDPNNIARNLVDYIKGFSPLVVEIFEKFKFEQEIEKLDNTNRLYQIVLAFKDINLHPSYINNIQMGYVFEELVRKFNEQANEEAGDHFTPREVIELMANVLYTRDEDLFQSDIARTIYDPTCGTGGMLSVSEALIKSFNDDANISLYGQEYNDESWALCCADLLIKDEPIENIILGDTLGDGKTSDGHFGKRFHYMLANPPFGVEWKVQEPIVKKEYKDLGNSGRFSVGLPRINDGALLFLMHMLSKMHRPPEEGGDGSKIAVVFNGSPMFTGDAGSGESNIRRWVIENDLLDAVIALPDQMFYNTGIYTYIWILSNRKLAYRKGKVQLIDATRHYQKMRKSLGNKRNELSAEHISEINRLYADFKHNDTSTFNSAGETMTRVASKVFDNREFAYLKLTVERPLRLNFQASPERIERLKLETAFINLASSKKRKDSQQIKNEEAEGAARQVQILDILSGLNPDKCYLDRIDFEEALNETFKENDLKLDAPIKKAILNALSERDEAAEICRDSKGRMEADSELRDTENVPLPADIQLPLDLAYDDEADKNLLIERVRAHCEAYLQAEVLPYVKDAWIDYSKIKVGYEIPLTRHFYEYQAPRPLAVIEQEIKDLEAEIMDMLKQVTQ